MTARECPDEKQVAYVGANDKQHKHRDNNHDLEGRKQMTGVIERRCPQRPDFDAAAAIGGGIFRFESRGNGRNFLLSLIAVHARLEPQEGFRPSRPAILQLVAARVENLQHRSRHPKLHAPADESPVKPLGRDPNDGVRGAVKTLRLADDFRVALEAGLPQMVADHYDRVRVAPGVFARRKAAAQYRMHSYGLKIVCGDDASGRDLGALANAQGRPGDGADKEGLTQGTAALQVPEIGPRGLVSLVTHRSGQRN